MKFMSSFWKNKTVLVTGGAGFVGSQLVSLLKKKKPKRIIIPRSKSDDLRQKEVCSRIVQNCDIVIHLAGNVGGIGYNQQFPADLFYDNLSMGLFLMDEARKAGVKKFVSIGTICSYPKVTQLPFKESNLWNGYPEETNAPYGLAKKMLLVQGDAYRQQYGFNSIYLLPVNMFGPGDKWNEKTSHVIPALIKKFLRAKQKNEKQVVVWGTGKATREFLYVKDGAEAVLLAAEKYDKPNPVNIGSSFEISIKNLAQTIKKIVGYTGKIFFDTTKPDGQPRRKLDTTRAKNEFGFEASTDFYQALQETISWYQQQKPQ